MYLSLAVVGYLSMMANPQGLITDRVPPASFGNLDLFMLIGRCAMTLNLIIALPVNINPCRNQILAIFQKEKKIENSQESLKSESELTQSLAHKDSNNNDNFKHVLITAILLFSSAGIAIVYPQINSAFGILGGTCSTMLSITFPGKPN